MHIDTASLEITDLLFPFTNPLTWAARRCLSLYEIQIFLLFAFTPLFCKSYHFPNESDRTAKRLWDLPRRFDGGELGKPWAPQDEREEGERRSDDKFSVLFLLRDGLVCY